MRRAAGAYSLLGTVSSRLVRGCAWLAVVALRDIRVGPDGAPSNDDVQFRGAGPEASRAATATPTTTVKPTAFRAPGFFALPSPGLYRVFGAQRPRWPTSASASSAPPAACWAICWPARVLPESARRAWRDGSASSTCPHVYFGHDVHVGETCSPRSSPSACGFVPALPSAARSVWLVVGCGLALGGVGANPAVSRSCCRRLLVGVLLVARRPARLGACPRPPLVASLRRLRRPRGRCGNLRTFGQAGTDRDQRRARRFYVRPTTRAVRPRSAAPGELGFRRRSCRTATLNLTPSRDEGGRTTKWKWRLGLQWLRDEAGQGCRWPLACQGRPPVRPGLPDLRCPEVWDPMRSARWAICRSCRLMAVGLWRCVAGGRATVTRPG